MRASTDWTMMSAQLDLIMAVAMLLATLINILLVVMLLLRRPARQGPDPILTERLGLMRDDVAKLPDVQRDEARKAREELSINLGAQQQALEMRFENLASSQAENMAHLRKEAADGREKLERALKESTEQFAQTQSLRLGQTNEEMKALAARLDGALQLARETQEKAMQQVEARIVGMSESNAKSLEAIRENVSGKLDVLRQENDQKLEQMRATVEEKLQGTLEKRLGESFEQVSKRLEEVHKGLGEMQSLATGVGDLKRVLTNVKSRGGWGEVQLGMLLEDMMAPEHFERNAKTNPNSNDMVEYVVRLPGKNDDKPVLLPIDAKFPHEDYERLLLAQEAGRQDEVARATDALIRAIKAQAKTISEKYINVPYTTDFAIMYLPTEGLFAEVIRQPGLAQDIQKNSRIMVTGPTTLAALLTSLMMGFRTLAIEKRSSEVWQILSAAKAEFQKYGQVWEKLQKQLDTARNTVEQAKTRTRAVERKLRDVDTLGAPVTPEFLALPDMDDDDDA